MLTGWLRRANHRIHATTRVRSAEAIYEDRGSRLAFPPVLPDTTLRFGVRLPRDHYVRFDTTTTRSTHASWATGRGASEPRCRGDPASRPRRVLRAMRAESVVANALAEAVEERDLSVYDRVVGMG